MLASAGGLKTSEATWLRQLNFDREEIMRLWRFAITSYLTKAHRDGLLESSLVPEDFDRMICKQARRRWNLHITPQMSKRRFLGYAGRYIRRLPISQRRILKVTPEEVVYQSKDTRTKTFVETHSRPDQFVAMLSPHVQDHYKHSMRYFGLLAPRTKRQTSAALFPLLGQQKRPKLPRQRWADSLKKHFGVDPLIDSLGNRMQWRGHRRPVPGP
jgi:Putative transposase